MDKDTLAALGFAVTYKWTQVPYSIRGEHNWTFIPNGDSLGPIVFGTIVRGSYQRAGHKAWINDLIDCHNRKYTQHIKQMRKAAMLGVG